jgi:dihydrodipicolinate synthase/N-acetylneuraminate lyase
LFKGVLKWRGLNVGPVRRPLPTAADDAIAACVRELEEAGVFISAR